MRFLGAIGEGQQVTAFTHRDDARLEAVDVHRCAPHLFWAWRRSLRSEATALQVDMPEIATLTAALAALTDWQTRARAALAMRTQLAELQQLAGEAESLPAFVPERSSIEVTTQNPKII